MPITTAISHFVRQKMPRLFVFFGQLYWFWQRTQHKISNISHIAQNHAQYAKAFEHNQQYDQALLFYQRALKIYKIQYAPFLYLSNQPCYLILQIQWLEKIGDILSQQQKIDRAQPYYKDALYLINKLPTVDGQPFVGLYVKYAKLCHQLAMNSEGLTIKHCLEQALIHLNLATAALAHFNLSASPLTQDISTEIAIVLHELDDDAALIAHYHQQINYLSNSAQNANEQGQWDDGLNNYLQALRMFQIDTPSPALYSIELQQQKLQLFIHISQTYVQLNRWSDVLHCTQKGLNLLDEMPFRQQNSYDLQRVSLKEWQAQAYQNLDAGSDAIALLHEVLELRETSAYLRGQRQQQPDLAKHLDFERALIYEKMADEHVKQQAFDQAVNGYSQAIELYETLHDVLFAHQVNPDLGRLYHKTANSLVLAQQPAMAAAYYQQELSQNQRSGHYFYVLGKLENAARYYVYTERLYHEAKITDYDSSQRQANLFRLVHIFNVLGRPDKAYTHGVPALALYQALSAVQQQNHRQAYLSLQINMLDSLREMNKLEQAWAYGQEALKMQQEQRVSAKQYPRLLVHLAMILIAKAGIQPWLLLSKDCPKKLSLQQKQWVKQAESLYREAFALYDKPNDDESLPIAEVFIHLQSANLFHSLCQWERALSHYQQATNLYLRAKLFEQPQMNHLAARLYSDMGYAHQALLAKSLSINSYSHVMSYYNQAEACYQKNPFGQSPLLYKHRVILGLRIASLWQQMHRWTMALNTLQEVLQLLISSPYDHLWPSMALAFCQLLADMALKSQTLDHSQQQSIHNYFRHVLALFPEALLVLQNTGQPHENNQKIFHQACVQCLIVSLNQPQNIAIFYALLAYSSLASHDFLNRQLQHALVDGRNMANKQRCLAFPEKIQRQATALQLISQQIYLPVNALDQEDPHDELDLSQQQRASTVFSQYQQLLDDYRHLKQTLFEAHILSAYAQPLLYISQQNLQQRLNHPSDDSVILFLVHEAQLPVAQQSFALLLHAQHWDVIYLPELTDYLHQDQSNPALYPPLWQTMAAQLSFVQNLSIIPLAADNAQQQKLFKLPYQQIFPERLNHKLYHMADVFAQCEQANH